MYKKMKMTKQYDKNIVHVQHHYGVSFYKKKRNFLIMIYVADMVILMSNFLKTCSGIVFRLLFLLQKIIYPRQS